MSRFKFKDWVFKNLLPIYFQENDSYRDTSGKGILQRFMEVCSEYFDTDIIDDKEAIPGLENILNLIDVDLTPELFLNYLWEFLGDIPYAYGTIISGKDIKPEDMGIREYTYQDFPHIKPRKLLKYAISLYKIRGTSKFYEILGRFYGVKITLVDTTNNTDDWGEPNYSNKTLAVYLDNLGEKTIATYALGDDQVRAVFKDGSCYNCFYYGLEITFEPLLYNYLYDKSKLEWAADIIKGIVEKYLPVQAKIAKYTNGQYKIRIISPLDFNSDFNQDFSIRINN